jgi:hypothetical protein
MQHVFMAMWEGMTKSIFNNILEQKKHKSIACDYKAGIFQVLFFAFLICHS